MRKNIFFAASIAALTFTGCANDEYVGEVENPKGELSEISFVGKNGAFTRADATEGTAAELLGNNFVVVGYKGDDTNAANTNLVFDHYNVNYKDGTANTTLSNSKNWEYVGQDMNVKGTSPSARLATSATAQSIKYWDNSVASYDFIAFSMGKGTGDPAQYAEPTAVQSGSLPTAAYTLQGNVDKLKECYISDITTVERPNGGYSTSPVVTMNFRHLTSKIRLALYETVPGYVVKDVKFKQSYQDVDGSYTNATSSKAIIFGDNPFNESGKYTVYFPTTGTANKAHTDYNKAHLSFVADETDGTSSHKEFSMVSYRNDAEGQISAGTTYLAQTAQNPSYCGATDANHLHGSAYITILPNEGQTKNIKIQIDYTLVSVDNSNEEIHVYGATAEVPAKYAAWKPGYAYTYIFKISRNTNGNTNTNVDDKGLTAITFDALVLDDEDGKQETITTVSETSITTYGYKDGKCTTGGNEYEAGTVIYATVAKSDGTTVQPSQLYTVTIDEGAAQDINEKTVANAIEHGPYNSEAKTYTVTDANGKKLIVKKETSENVTSVPTSADTSLAINAIKWTAVANTIYVVEYDDSPNKHYKIVRIN